MWVVGLVIFLALVSAAIVLAGWEKNKTRLEPLWEARSLAMPYTTVMGPLAAFSVASAIFVAGVSVTRQTQAFYTVVGMLLIAYVIFTGTAMMFISTPTATGDNAAEEKLQRLQKFAVAIGIFGYGIGVGTGWLSIKPLLLAIGLGPLADAFTWILLATTVAACTRWSLFLYRMLECRLLVASLVPAGGLAAAITYYLAAQLIPGLWPTDHDSFKFAIVIFAIAFTGFGAHTLMLMNYGRPGFDNWLERHGHRVALGLYSVAATSLYLLWFAVALSANG